jgi:predicted nuclease with RNAse H fold
MDDDALLIGWDVGGWDCERNSRSRDALVVLDADRQVLGRPWRGNLRRTINEADGGEDWIECLLALCGVDRGTPRAGAVLAIDAPLGVAAAFRALVNGQPPAGDVYASDSNPYLYRETERFLIERGHRPLSAVKDMIGSQSSKAMHALARFTPDQTGTGVWSGGRGIEAIEAYPAVARKSGRVQRLLDLYVHSVLANGERFLDPVFEYTDHEDALLCALVAWLFVHEREALAAPEAGAPEAEGWIWVPVDALDDPPRERVDQY